MGYTLVTSLVDTPGAPPPVQWRVTTVGLSGNKSFGLDIVGVCSTSRLELQRRLDAGLMQIYREIEGNHMTDLAYTTVDATPDVVANAGHPSNGLALLAAAVHQSEPWTTLPDDFVYCGSVAADGTVLPPVNPIALALQAKQLGKTLVMEYEAARTAAYVYDRVLGVADAAELYRVVGGEVDAQAQPRPPLRKCLSGHVDLSHVRGQAAAKYALEVAIAGGHDCLLIGSPGEGKSLLAKCIPGIAPALTDAEAIEVAQVYHAAGKLSSNELPAERPLRSIDATITKQALLGGGSDVAYPGEVSLAHNGYLYFDEILQCTRSTLEGLRTPLQEGSISISRTAWKATFPARFQLIAASNPCSCGFWDELDPGRCTCTETARAKYRSKLSGPLLDRIEVRSVVRPLGVAEYLSDAQPADDSATVRARITSAIERQMVRQGVLNAHIPPQQEHILQKDIDKAAVLEYATGRTIRGVVALLKLGRTVADLDGSDTVTAEHMRLARQLSPDMTT